MAVIRKNTEGRSHRHSGGALRHSWKPAVAITTAAWIVLCGVALAPSAQAATHPVAVTITNTGSQPVTVETAGVSRTIQPKASYVEVGRASSGVDVEGQFHFACMVTGHSGVSWSEPWRAKNPWIGAPEFTFPHRTSIPPVTSFGVGDSAEYRFGYGMAAVVTRAADWYYGDNWGWVKHFNMDIHGVSSSRTPCLTPPHKQ